MTKHDKMEVKLLHAANFKVVVRDVNGRTFNERYDVYQPCGFDRLKRVVLDEKGRLVGLEG